MTDSLGFLLSDVARLLRRRFDERARASGISVAQWRVLKILDRHPGLKQGQLAELLEVEPITCCRMIDRMEEHSFVERRRDPADRRAWQLYVTGTARPLLADLRTVGENVIEDALQGFDASQRDALIAALETMRSNLSNQHETSEAANG